MNLTLKKFLKRAIPAVFSIPFVTPLLRRPILWFMKTTGWFSRAAGKLLRLTGAIEGASLFAGKSKLEYTTKYYLSLKETVQLFPIQPKISVLVPVYKVSPKFLWEALQSVAQQIYPNWELCLCDDASNDPKILEVIGEFQKKFPSQVKLVVHEKNSQISVTSNDALKLATGDYIALLDHDDRLYPNALAEMVRYINLQNEPEILYSDESVIDDKGTFNLTIYHKPAWSPYKHLTSNYTTHLSVYRRSLIEKIGGFRVGFEGSQDHDLMLRAVENTTKPVVHVPFVLYQWRAHRQSTSYDPGAKPYAAIAGEKAIKEAMVRRGRECEVEFDSTILHYRLRFAIPTPQPMVSIVIPSKESAKVLGRCLQSIVDKSTYQNYEILISDNGSVDPETFDLYHQYSQKLDGRFHVIRKERAFNFAAQNNDAVRVAKGEYIVLLNNDTEVIEPRWIEEMLSLAQFPEVGAVGCKLLFGTGTLQHGGAMLVGRHIAEHIGFGLAANDNLYWNFLNSMHECSVVTAACLLISKKKYWEVGGLDEHYLPNGWGDVEFCLALRDRGYLNLYTPHSRLYHHESATRGISVEYFEHFYLLNRRGRDLLNDPYINPNLDVRRFEPAEDNLTLDISGKDFLYFLNTPMDQWGKKVESPPNLASKQLIFKADRVV